MEEKVMSWQLVNTMPCFKMKKDHQLQAHFVQSVVLRLQITSPDFRQQTGAVCRVHQYQRKPIKVLEIGENDQY